MQSDYISVIIGLISILQIGRVCEASEAKFIKVECKVLDESVVRFRHCDLRMPSRGTVAIHIYAEIKVKPVTNSIVNICLYRRSNGYRPFLFNVSDNGCRVMKERKKRTLLNMFLDVMLKNSNINHTCPYDHDLIVDGPVLTKQDFLLFPYPTGDYMFKVTLGTNDVWAAEMKVYFSYI